MEDIDKDELIFLFLLVASGIFAMVLMCIFENFSEYIFGIWGLFISILILRTTYKQHYYDDNGW